MEPQKPESNKSDSYTSQVVGGLISREKVCVAGKEDGVIVAENDDKDLDFRDKNKINDTIESHSAEIRNIKHRASREILETATKTSSEDRNIIPDDEETYKDSNINDGEDDNTKSEKKRGRKLKKQSEKRTAFDGRKVVFVTEFTQTDWNWKNKAEKSGKSTIVATSADNISVTSSRSSALKSILVKSDSRQSLEQTPTETENRQPVKTVTDLTPLYFVPDDEFGVPLTELSTDSDSSDPESYKQPKHYQHHLPSVGPPQILRYIRESDMLEKETETADGRLDDDQKQTISQVPSLSQTGIPMEIFFGLCEFCGVDIKPFPTLDQQLSQPPESLYCCEEYQDFVEFAINVAARLEEDVVEDSKQISIKVHAHHGSSQDRQLAKEKAVQRMRERELQRREQEAAGAHIPGAQATGIQATGAQATGAQASTHHFGPDAKFGNTPGALSERQTDEPGGLKDVVARQMKTINYQLSSQRCLEEGWTLRVPSPMEYDDLESEIFIPESLHPAMIAGGKVRDRPMIEKFYPNGNKFLTIFPDGTGNVFYPSGRLSILIVSVSLGQNTYIVQDDSDLQTLLAVFEPNGCGYCYFSNGKVRLTFDQIGGLELDYSGGRKRVWSWKDQETHVHVPPFQPIVFGLNSYLGIRFMAQENIALTLTGRKRSCRFNVGAKLKVMSPDNIPPRGVEEHQLVINKHKVKVETILNKITNILKFPKSPKVDSILPPLSVSARKQKVDKMKQTSSQKSQKAVKQNRLPPLDSSAVPVN